MKAKTHVKQRQLHPKISTESNSLSKNLKTELISKISIPDVMVYDFTDPEMEGNGFLESSKASISLFQKHPELLLRIMIQEIKN